MGNPSDWGIITWPEIVPDSYRESVRILNNKLRRIRRAEENLSGQHIRTRTTRKKGRSSERTENATGSGHGSGETRTEDILTIEAENSTNPRRRSSDR